MAASAGTVTLDLDANSVRLVRELMKAQGQTKRSARSMQRSMSNAFRSMGRNAALFGVGLAAVSKKSIEFADRIGKTADKLGLSTRNLQVWRFAADRSGLSVEQFDKSMERFNRTIGEYTQGLSTTVRAYDQLGVSVRDSKGQLRSSEEVFLDVADALSKIENAGLQAALAGNLFGGRNIAILNTIKDGRDGLNEYAAAADRLGIVLDDKLVRDAEAAQDAMTDLTKVLQVRVATAVTENTDSIISLTEGLITFIDAVGRATRAWNEWLATQGVGVDSIDEIRTRGAELLKQRQDIERQLAEGADRPIDSRLAWFYNLFGTQDEMRAQLEARRQAIIDEQMQLQDKAVALQKGQKPGEAGPAPSLLNPEGVNTEAQQVRDTIAKLLADLQKDLATFGMGDEAVLIELMDLGAGQEALNQASDMLGKLQAMELSEDQRKEAAKERAEMESEYQALIDQTLTDVEAHAGVIARINELYAAGIIPNAEAYGEIIKRVNEEFVAGQDKNPLLNLEEFGKEAARNIQSEFADFLFDPFDEGLEGMVKSFAKTMQRMAAEAAAAAILQSVFGGAGGGGGGGIGDFFSGFMGAFGGGKAAGGPIQAGTPYLVGEKGPELIVPGLSGMVIPTDKLAGGGSRDVTINLPPEAKPRTALQTAQRVAARQRQAETRNR